MHIFATKGYAFCLHFASKATLKVRGGNLEKEFMECLEAHVFPATSEAIGDAIITVLGLLFYAKIASSSSSCTMRH